MKFLHIADLHLGQRHMQLEARYNDFFETLQAIFEHAAKEKVDFVIICGDMFDKKQLDAESLTRTVALLRSMQEKHIPLFAIEGNHDQRLFLENNSFLDFLCKEGLLTLLRPTIVEGEEVLKEWDEPLRTGGVYTFTNAQGEKAQLIGMGYITSSIQKEKLQMLEEALNASRLHPCIVMMHGSVGGGIPGSIEYALLAPFKERIDYLGLGHWHRKMEIEGWIFNPGSMEHTDINRDDISKGYFIVELSEKEKKVQFFESGKRPAVRISLSLPKLPTLEEALFYLSTELPKMISPQEESIMCKLTLRGLVEFNPLELSKKHLEEIISGITPLLFLEFENLLHTEDFEVHEDITMDSLSSRELEEEVISHLLAKSSEFQEETTLLTLIPEIKKLLLAKEDPAHIISLLE